MIEIDFQKFQKKFLLIFFPLKYLSKLELNKLINMQKDFIEVQPNHISFYFPHQIKTKIILKNITLHQIFIKIISSHPDNYIIQPNKLKLQSFDETTILVTVKYYQEALLSNYLNNKLIIYNYDYDEQGDIWNEQEGIKTQNMLKISRLQMNINSSADTQNYLLVQSRKKCSILKITKFVGKKIITYDQKTSIVKFLESIGQFQSFHCINNKICFAMFSQLDQNVSFIKQFENNQTISIYSICKLPLICKDKIIQKVLQMTKINEEKEIIKKMHQENEFIQQKSTKNIFTPINNRQQNTEIFSIQHESQQINYHKFSSSTQCIKHKHIQQLKQYSQNLSSSQIKYRIRQDNFTNSKINLQKSATQFSNNNQIQKSNQISKNKQQNGVILNCVIEPIAFITSSSTQPQLFYILFDNFLQIYQNQQNLKFSKKIFIQKIKPKTLQSIIIMKQCGHKIVIAFDSNFYIINTKNKSCSIIHIKRKQIYDFVHLPEQKLLIVGGRTCSKLQYFGKNTTRSNIKVFEFKDEYNHVYSHQLEQSGDVLVIRRMNFFNKNILFIFQRTTNTQLIYILKVNDWNHFHVLAKIDIKYDLAIREIREFKCLNEEIYVLQNINIKNEKLTFVKKIKVDFWDWKPNIKTETLTTIKPQIYNFFTNDQDFLVFYSVKKQELTLFNTKKKTNKQIPLKRGFKKFAFKQPNLYILRDFFIQIIKII